MKRIILATIILALVPCLGQAQTSDYSRGHGYFYFAPGFAASSGEKGTATAHIGFGGEGFFTRHFGAGVDAGYVTPFENFKDGIGTFSPNFVARFRAKSDDNKVEPFVTGGYTLFFREGTVSGANFGGGVNYWFKKRVGLRLELRDNVSIPGGDVSMGHFVGMRIGLTFN
jgi:hypothetical protein